MPTPYYLERPRDSIVWDLRTCWAKGFRVALTLDEAADERRVEGTVQHVSPTGTTAIVSGLHVPLSLVLAVHRPSRLGDSTMDDELERWRGHPPKWAQQTPGQMELF